MTVTSQQTNNDVRCNIKTDVCSHQCTIVDVSSLKFYSKCVMVFCLKLLHFFIFFSNMFSDYIIFSTVQNLVFSYV